MGLLETIRKSRAKTKAEIAFAKKRAKHEAKETAKADLKRAKLLDKAEKRLIKEEKKGLKAKRKHDEKLAKAELQKIREGGFSRQNMSKAVGGLRVALPILLPLAYRGITALRDRQLNQHASKVGVSSDELAQYSGHGAELKARIEGIRANLDGNSALTVGFKQDVDDRLTELRTAIDNAAYMNPEQRNRAHGAIERDLEAVTAEIQAKTMA